MMSAEGGCRLLRLDARQRGTPKPQEAVHGSDSTVDFFFCLYARYSTGGLSYVC